VLDTVTRADKLIETEHFTRTVEASLCFSRGGGRTVLARQRLPYPFHATRTFHLDQARPDLATLYLQSAAGGLYSPSHSSLYSMATASGISSTVAARCCSFLMASAYL
jgi:urease accessory protein